jgi:hypothetical protein
MEYCKITYIYGLYEVGKEDIIRYIGKSDNPKKRLKDHRNDKRKTSHKSCWVLSVVDRGSQIGIKPIQVVSSDNWKEREMFWISEMRKSFDLVNNTDGGDGSKESIFLSYDESINWIKNSGLSIKSIKQYKEWSKTSNFPNFLPKAPDRVFSEWTTWGDYLGTGIISTLDRRKYYLSYDESKKYLKDNFNLNNSSEFKKSEIPVFIPKKPYRIYTEWCGWEDFLGYKSNIRKKDHKYLSYEEAKKWIRENLPNLTSKKYSNLCKSNKIPTFLHKKPYIKYKNFSWWDYLSNNSRRDKSAYMNYNDARKIVHSLKLKSNAEWRKWCKNKDHHHSKIPNSPSTVYKEEWSNWYHWLGN